MTFGTFPAPKHVILMSRNHIDGYDSAVCLQSLEQFVKVDDLFFFLDIDVSVCLSVCLSVCILSFFMST